jgi:hypothetical protein
MRTRLLVASLYLLGLGCSSPARPSGGGTGGEEDTGGSPGSTGGKSGGDTGGKSGNTGGTSGGTGGSGDTGGSGGAATGGASGGSGGAGGAATGGRGGAGGSGGAAGGSGGSAGGAGGSAGGATGSSGCAGSTAKVCDDFDAQTMGAEPKGMYAVVKTNNATVTVDTTRAFSGKQSLHLHLTNPGSDSKAQLAFTAPVLPFMNNDVHGRAMVWLVKNPANHWDFATAFGTDQPQDDDTKIQYTVGSMSGHLMAVYQPGDDSVDSTTQFPVGRWGCLQWEFKGAPDGSHVLKIMLDGKLIDKGNITKGGPQGNWPATTWKSMKVGWINFGSVGMAVDMWIDDLAVSDAEIPCAAAM